MEIKKKLAGLVLGNLTVGVLLLIILSSCMTENKFISYAVKHPDKAAIFCSERFPVSQKIVKGKPDTIINTVITPGETIPCPEPTVSNSGKLNPGSVKCPDVKTINNTIVRIDTIYQPDRALEQVLTDKYNSSNIEKVKLKTKLEQAEKKNSKKTWIIVLLAAASGVMLFLLIKK